MSVKPRPLRCATMPPTCASGGSRPAERLRMLGVLSRIFLGACLIAICTGATAPPVWLNLLSLTDSNIAGTVVVSARQMTIDMCCVVTPQYSLAIGQGTCSAPVLGAAAVIARRQDWRLRDGHLHATIQTIFPLRSSAKYHISLIPESAQSAAGPVACADVPAGLVIAP